MKARLPLTILTALLIFAAGYAALFIAPEEKTMRAIQRIFYFHLPSWIAMFSAFSVVFYANVAYLITRNRKWDALGVSGVEVGVICCTIGLMTGPLWARPVWGIWWTWDARLTTTFILWLLYIAYLLLRGLLEDPEKKASLSAIFGIFASLDIPLVYLSNRLWRTQHPAPVIGGDADSGMAPPIATAFVWNIVAWAAWGLLILTIRVAIERRQQAIDRAAEAAALAAD